MTGFFPLCIRWSPSLIRTSRETPTTTFIRFEIKAAAVPKNVQCVGSSAMAATCMSCYQEAESQDLYVKKSDGVSVYEGWCWPGGSR